MAIPATIASGGAGSGAWPVAASCGVGGVAVGLGVGVLVGTEGHVDGIVPSVRVTGRYFEASATSAWVVESASGAAVCEDVGLENPRPPLSNWNVRRSLTAFFPAMVHAVPVGSSPMASSA